MTVSGCMDAKQATDIKVFVDFNAVMARINMGNKPEKVRLGESSTYDMSDANHALKTSRNLHNARLGQAVSAWDKQVTQNLVRLETSRSTLEDAGVLGLARVRKDADEQRSKKLQSERVKATIEEQLRLGRDEADLISLGGAVATTIRKSDASVTLLRLAAHVEEAFLSDPTAEALPVDIAQIERAKYDSVTARVETLPSGELKIKVTFPGNKRARNARINSEVVRAALLAEADRIEKVYEQGLAGKQFERTTTLSQLRGASDRRLRQRLDIVDSATPIDVSSAVRAQEVGDVIERTLSVTDNALTDVQGRLPKVPRSVNPMDIKRQTGRVYRLDGTVFRERKVREVKDWVLDTTRRNGWRVVFDRSPAELDKTQFVIEQLIKERLLTW